MIARRRLVLGALLILLLVAAALLFWPRRGVTLSVQLEPSVTLVTPGQRVTVRAVVAAGPGERLAPGDLEYTWEASAGTVAGAGAAATWTSTEVGVARVSVEVRHRGGARAGDQVDLAVMPLAEVRRLRGETPASAPAAARPRPRPPVIEEVVFEKQEVCLGEEFQATVTARGQEGDDAYLRVVQGGVPGPVAIHRRHAGGPEVMRVAVFGKAGDLTIKEVPLPRLKDCEEPYRVGIVHRLQPNSSAEYELRATVFPLKVRAGATRPDLGKAVQYVWDFGDGSPALTTEERAVVHDYGGRRQQTEHTSFIVTVVVRTERGREVTGRQHLQLRNFGFIQRDTTGVVSATVSLEPRFAYRDAQGVVAQQAHIYPDEPARVTRLVIERRINPDAPQDVTEEVNVLDVLGTTDLGQQGVTLPMRYESRPEDQTYVVNYRLEGTTASGAPFRTMASLVIPSAKWESVTDQQMEAKLLKALKLTGQKTITREELDALERKGLLRP